MLDSEEVARFLEGHPSFFEERQDLLVQMKLSSEQSPFHERQLEVLRQRHSAEQAKYALVVDSAKNNQSLEQQLHDLARLLLAHGSPSVTELADTLRNHFSLERAVTVLVDHNTESPGEENSQDRELLFKRVAHGNSVCDDRVSSSVLRWLFDDESLKSCSFVPLLHPGENGDQSKFEGVLVLGSVDGERFKPGMGTIYLDRIGELVAAYLRGCA